MTHDTKERIGLNNGLNELPFSAGQQPNFTQRQRGGTLRKATSFSPQVFSRMQYQFPTAKNGKFCAYKLCQ